MTARKRGPLRLTIEYLAPDAVRPRARNARRHDDAQIAKLMDSIRAFGFVVPIGVDDAGEIVFGHGRVEAAKRLGLAEVPAVRVRHLSPAQLRALAIADNQMASQSSWHPENLAFELRELVLDETLDFSVSVTGFEAAEIDALVFGADFAAPDPADAVLPEAGAAVTQVGDVWRAEGLTLVCGDALSAAAYAAALGGERAAMALTDPPYNVAIGGHVSGKGKHKHREFVQASGEMREDEFIDFLTAACRRLKQHLSPSALAYVFMDGAHLYELTHAARAAGLTQKALCTWAKTNAGMGSLYRSQTEHVLVLKVGSGAHTNNVQLGRFGRNRTTLWTYPGANAFGRNRDAALAQHPTVKPIGLLADAILDASAKGELILDPFAGSGSTLIAAHRVHRRAAGIELDPLYVDSAIARISAVTGLAFVRDRDGAAWADVAAEAA